MDSGSISEFSENSSYLELGENSNQENSKLCLRSKGITCKCKPLYLPYFFHYYIRQVFSSLEWVQITKSVLWNFAIIWILPFLNNPKDLDPSYRMDLDFWDCFGRKRNLSSHWRNTVQHQEQSDQSLYCLPVFLKFLKRPADNKTPKSG